MIIWDPQKNEKLKKERGISFEEVKALILSGEVLAMDENPVRIGQFIFLTRLNGYVHIVPFIFDKDRNIILKTVYPSRKFNKWYSL